MESNIKTKIIVLSESEDGGGRFLRNLGKHYQTTLCYIPNDIIFIWRHSVSTVSKFDGWGRGVGRERFLRNMTISSSLKSNRQTNMKPLSLNLVPIITSRRSNVTFWRFVNGGTSGESPLWRQLIWESSTDFQEHLRLIVYNKLGCSGNQATRSFT
jgi:hypothetical protein